MEQARQEETGGPKAGPEIPGNTRRDVAMAPHDGPLGMGQGWWAELHLAFAKRPHGTIISARRHRGPLCVQRPFYPEGEVCHTYLLHPPGGLVGGDRLNIEVTCGPGSHALLTTPAATKFYRSAGAAATQRNDLRLERDAILEWLPQETIYFEGAIAETRTQVSIEPGAFFFGWEFICLGRPAAGEGFDRGRIFQQLELLGPDGPMWVERTRLAAGTPVMSAPWGMGGYPVSATFVAAPALPGMVKSVRNAWEPPAVGDWAAVSEMNSVLVGRFLGNELERARKRFTQAWQALRPIYADRPACPPRIWST